MGSMSSMNVTLKNNRKLLRKNKHKPFSKMNGGGKNIVGYKPYVLPKVQPHVLRRIRRRVRKENKKLLIKKILIALVTLLVIVMILVYKSLTRLELL
ncbi:hypothetical protein AB9K26_03460 [Psychroserpens sp. XS_ASV72]|uniref:hypothetical protein n=1 Tax=Psychroserpens sp. XS_ASV72 TaxID=3241293 RepID=UPI003517239F